MPIPIGKIWVALDGLPICTKGSQADGHFYVWLLRVFFHETSSAAMLHFKNSAQLVFLKAFNLYQKRWLLLNKSRGLCLSKYAMILLLVWVVTEISHIEETPKCLQQHSGRILFISPTHLNKGTSCLQQKCTQLLTPFSGTVFHALKNDVNQFCREC